MSWESLGELLGCLGRLLTALERILTILTEKCHKSQIQKDGKDSKRIKKILLEL